jgi:hypothetical protein
LIRWKKRWPIVPASVLFGFLSVTQSWWLHDGQAEKIVVGMVCFDVVVIIFSFQWGGENLSDPNSNP